MKTAKQYLQDKYPSMRSENWNITAQDDNWTAKQMEEYADYKVKNHRNNNFKPINQGV